MRADQEDGQLRFRLGIVERWFVGVCAAAIIAGGWRGLDLFMEQGRSINDLNTKQAVTNSQLATISAQLSVVPVLTKDVSELKVRVDRHDEDIRELRGTRGLK